MISRQAEISGDLAERCRTLEHAYETTKADRDRLLPYEHAFVTTAADRDRIQAEYDSYKVDQLDRNLGLAAYALVNDLKIPLEILEDRLSGERDSRSLTRRASDGLLSLAETIFRACHGAQTGLSFVETALAIDNSFRGQHHALHVYYIDRYGPDAYADYFIKGTKQGMWPDLGTSQAQSACIEGGIPPIFIATLPKSGSIYIWSAIQATINAPTFTTAMPHSLLDERLVDDLLGAFAKGGMISQHHLPASTHNLEMFRKHGIGKVIVHLRDPRQAAVSWWHYGIKIGLTKGTLTGADRDQLLWSSYVEPAIAWINGWVDAKDIDVHFSTQEDMAGNERAHITKMMQFIGLPAENLVLPSKSDKVHFRTGRKDEWRTFFQPEMLARMRSAIRSDVAARFGWSLV